MLDNITLKKLNHVISGHLKRICFCLTAFAWLTAGAMSCLSAPGYDQVADFSQTASEKEIGRYGMVPVYGFDIADGTYVTDTQCTSPFFRILEAKLTVEDGEITARLTMSSRSYLFVYMGTAEEAAAAPFEDYIPLEEENGRATFTIPVKALNTGIECAAFSKKRELWYSRKILFDASGLPAQAVAFPVPDYRRIASAIKLYDKEKGTDTKAELEALQGNTAETDAGEAAAAAKEPVRVEEKDGVYSIDTALTGGSGRASVTSPTWFYVKEGRGYAKLLWSSSYYDYMIVDGVIYPNETTDGSNSTFTIPVTVFNEPMDVIADTTAMGEPLEIAYTLTFYADTIGSKNRVPQEGARHVIIIALVLMIGGGILNHFAKKRKT